MCSRTTASHPIHHALSLHATGLLTGSGRELLTIGGGENVPHFPVSKINFGGRKMPTITLSVPEDLKKDMDDSKEINWSEVARAAIREKVSQLRILKSIAAKSQLTEKDALELGRKINKSLHERYKKEHPGAY